MEKKHERSVSDLLAQAASSTLTSKIVDIYQNLPPRSLFDKDYFMDSVRGRMFRSWRKCLMCRPRQSNKHRISTRTRTPSSSSSMPLGSRVKRSLLIRRRPLKTTGFRAPAPFLGSKMFRSRERKTVVCVFRCPRALTCSLVFCALGIHSSLPFSPDNKDQKIKAGLHFIPKLKLR